MLKNTLILTLVFIICITISSCNNSKIDAQLEQILLELPNVTQSETAVKITDDITNIISPYYTVSGDRYYFEVKKQGETKGISILAYIDLKTKTNGYICNDPLCSHMSQSECKYSDFKEAYCTDDNILFSLRGVDSVKSTSVYRVDLSNDKVKKVYTPQNDYVSAVGAFGGNFFFYDIKEIIKGNIVEYLYNLKSIDGITGEICDYGYFPDEYVTTNADIFFIKDGVFWFSAIDRIFSTDSEYKNENVILTLTGDNNLGEWYYDTDTDELFFNVRNQEMYTGSIYRYFNGKTEQINLPHEQIYYFTLTENYIYYSSYDPLYYGISAAPGNPEVYDYAGGKIYKANRNNISESSLVFDCGDKYVICRPPSTNYIIVGNMLYFTQGEVVHDGEYTYFSKAVNVTKVCIDLLTNEIEVITFE